MLSKAQLADAIEHALAGRWHRQEGDLPNAQYWYARCKRRLRKNIAPQDELREIRAALG